MIVCPFCRQVPSAPYGWLGRSIHCPCVRLRLDYRGSGGLIWSPCGLGLRAGYYFMKDGVPEVWRGTGPWCAEEPDDAETLASCLEVLGS